jgi:hypothetical protein
MEDSLEMSDTMFRQIGDAAISSYVFRRTHHGWEMIASAVAIIPFADFESRPVDPKALDTYLGVWTVAPGSSTVTLTREGDKLMAQGSNETEKTELLALADNTFVVRGDSDVITLRKDRTATLSACSFVK